MSHIESSVRFILDAAGSTVGPAALVLGCGRCAEIPVSSLGRRFSRLQLVDADVEALTRVAGRFGDEGGRYQYRRADLTGIVRAIQEDAKRIAAEQVDGEAAIEELAKSLLSHTPRMWSPPDGRRFDFVVCSGVLTQLQARVRGAAERVFRERFPDDAELLRSQASWRRAIWQVARRLEDAFVSHLPQLCARHAVICLSDTVRVNWLRRSGEETFMTEGTWIATQTPRLIDYLPDSADIIAQGQWTWLRQQQEGPYWGRLYDVQAVAYR
jgi:hypothetical protein